MYTYEYSVSLEDREGAWYYTIAQEINGEVEFLGWGYADSAEQAAECISAYIKEQFNARS